VEDAGSIRAMAVSSKAESRMSSPRGDIVGNRDRIAKGNVGNEKLCREAHAKKCPVSTAEDWVDTRHSTLLRQFVYGSEYTVFRTLSATFFGSGA